MGNKLNVSNIGENMTDANAAGETVESEVKPVQAEATQETQAPSTVAETVAVENNQDSLKVDKEANPDEAPEVLKEKLTQSNAESARRREKEKELKAENKRQAAENKLLTERLEAIEGSAPTIDSVGGDYDKLEDEKRIHAAMVAQARLDKAGSDQIVEQFIDPLEEVYQAQVDKAGQGYMEKLQNYYDSGGNVTQEALAVKAQIVNKALMERPVSQRAEIIEQLTKVNTVNALINLAGSQEYLDAIADGDPFEAMTAIHKSAVMQKTVSQAPTPVPEVEGSGGIAPQGDPSKMSPTQYRAWKASRK